MRVLMTVSIGVLLGVGALSAHLHGTYTIRPDSTGDFVDFQSAGNALMDSGIDGDCVFEADAGIYGYPVDLCDIAGNDSWAITFRNVAGEKPLLQSARFECLSVNRLTLENLTYEACWPSFEQCRDCRISGCRFDPSSDIFFRHCSSFTITGNIIHGIGGYEGILLHDCPDFVFANNFLRLYTPTDTQCGAINAPDAVNLKLYYNTFWCPSWFGDGKSCVDFEDAVRLDIKNNIFVLGRGCGRFSSCVRLWTDHRDSLDFDYNCYFAESSGFLAAWDETLFIGLTAWQALGFDLHGLYADPLLYDTSNLHLRPGSPCIRAGTPIPGFTTDFDGDPRDPVHPCVGADEYGGGAVTERGDRRPHV